MFARPEGGEIAAAQNLLLFVILPRIRTVESKLFDPLVCDIDTTRSYLAALLLA